MKTNYPLVLLFLVIFSPFLSAQNVEIIHKSNGFKKLVPIQSIDSVYHQIESTPNQRVIYQANNNIFSQSIQDIDSITFNTFDVDVYNENAIFCNEVTEIVEVVNPATGKIWMDRNLGALQVATNSTDENAFGDLYQWGRSSDGHQCRDAEIRSSGDNFIQPGFGDFLSFSFSGNKWITDLEDIPWQTKNDIFNPCPEGFRLPTIAEFEEERNSWESNNADGAFNSPLKFSVGGFKSTLGNSNLVGEAGNYWSSSYDTYQPKKLTFNATQAFTSGTSSPFEANCVRCIKDIEAEFVTINCSNSYFEGVLEANETPINSFLFLPNTDGDGGSYQAMEFASTGIEGLVAKLNPGSFTPSDGTLQLEISGTAETTGTATFEIELFNQVCTFNVDVIEEFNPLNIKSILTGNGSQEWVMDSNVTGHFGVGSNDSHTPNFFSATPNSLDPCLYDDVLTFSLDDNNNIIFNLTNQGLTFVNSFYVDQFGGNIDAQEDECLTVDVSGDKIVNLSYANSGINEDFTTNIQLNISNDGFFSYFINTSTYEILEVTDDYIYVRAIMTPPAQPLAWYLRFKPVD